MGFVVATYAVYEADIEEFVSYYKGQGVSRICVYVGRSYIPATLPHGADIEYVVWPAGDPEAKATADAQTRFGDTGDWYAWIALNERYYIARNITMAEYLEMVTPSFGAVRVQAHLARVTGPEEIEYCKEGLPWTPGDKAGLIRRNAEPTLDSGVAKKLHILRGEEAEKLTGTLYTVPISKS